MKELNCVFCNISKDWIIAEDELSFAISDGFPVSDGHSLIMPKRHVSDYFDLTQDEIMSMQSLLKRVKADIESKFSPDGYNVGINIGEPAGQTVFHVHMHLIPRYKGDVGNPRGGVRGVIPDKQKY